MANHTNTIAEQRRQRQQRQDERLRADWEALTAEQPEADDDFKAGLLARRYSAAGLSPATRAGVRLAAIKLGLSQWPGREETTT